MSLNEKEEKILKQIEQGLIDEDPDLAKTVKDTTLSKFTRSRAVISFFMFIIGLFVMLGTYIIQPLFALVGFSVMAISGYVFVVNTKALLNAENISEWNFSQVFRILKNSDSSRQK